MSCPVTNLKDYDIQRLLEYVNNNNANYQDWFQRYSTSTSATSAAIISNALGNSNKVSKIVTLVNATSAMEIVVNGRTVYIPLLSAI